MDLVTISVQSRARCNTSERLLAREHLRFSAKVQSGGHVAFAIVRPVRLLTQYGHVSPRPKHRPDQGRAREHIHFSAKSRRGGQVAIATLRPLCLLTHCEHVARRCNYRPEQLPATWRIAVSA